METIVSRFWQNAAQHPEKIVYKFLPNGEGEEQDMTLDMLRLRAQALGAFLQEQGFTDKRVILLYPPGLEFVECFWACMIAGVVAVPAAMTMDFMRLPESLNRILNDCSPVAMLTTQGIIDVMQGMFPDHETVLPLPKIPTDEIPTEKGKNFVQRPISPEKLAFLQYTSGSTSAPKGVMVTHKNLMANENLIAYYTQMDIYKSGCCWLPHFHDMGLIGNYLPPVLQAGTLVFMSPLSFVEDPMRWLRALSKYKGCISAAPNFAYELCAKRITEAELDQLDLSCWKVALTGSEPVRMDVIKLFSKIFKRTGFEETSFLPTYGMAEATLMVTCKPQGTLPRYILANRRMLQLNQLVRETNISSSVVAELTSCGVSSMGNKVVVVNPDTSTPVAKYVIGEIWISGDIVCEGYWNKPELTQATFKAKIPNDDSLYLRSGDLGFIDDMGELYVTGRIKDLIIIRGKNFYPQDIELALETSHQALRNGCSAAFSLEQSGHETIAIVAEIKKSYMDEDKDAIVKAIRQRITERFEVQVGKIVLIKSNVLPKTSSGKVQRGATKKALLDSSLKIVHQWSVKADLPKELEDIQAWLIAEVAKLANLAIDEISIHDTFNSLGVDSIAVPEFLDHIRKHFNRKIGIQDFINNDSIESLSLYLFYGTASYNDTDEPAAETLPPPQATNHTNPTPKQAGSSETEVVMPDFSILD
jgi:acyl-CoA synthetase (AMP-forming)/AMP-acid ligase II/acyl carrier protein